MRNCSISMNRLFYFFILSFLVFQYPADEGYCQDRKLVTGRIVDKQTGKPFDKNTIDITIYAFDTEAQAEDALKVLNEGNGVVLDALVFMPPDISGYYQGTVAQTGALIFKPDMAPGILERVNYRSEINVSVNVGEMLTASRKIGTATSIQALSEETSVDGNYLNALYTFRLPAHLGRRNSRMILQPFFMDGMTGDTLSLLKPWIYEGTQYNLTQERRMDFDLDNDPLEKYVVSDTLSGDGFTVPWRDTVYLNNPRGKYYIKGKLQFEDYNGVYYSKDSIPLASVRARRPMQFLEYRLEAHELDPAEYYVRPRPEKINTTGAISLTFKINKAELDDRDTLNRHYLADLKNRLLDIVHEETSKLKEFHILGIASPDGMYGKNLDLAQKRTAYAQRQIISVLPESVQERVYMTAKAEVAPWESVKELLVQDSLLSVAAELDSIIRKYPGRHDRQSLQIRQLASYRKVIMPYLPRLRTVKYTYVHEEFRELTPEEVLAKYRTDKEYASGSKHFDLYEYWHLFRMIEDPEEKAAISRRAYDETLNDNGMPWILAANNLAASYIAKGQPDTTLLAPFIDTRFRCNRKIRQSDGSYEILNPDAVVANQLCMFLMLNQFRRASVLCQMLPSDGRFDKLIALTMCLGGYYKGGDNRQERQQRNMWFETVKESSPVNKVVMLLALNTKAHDALAEKAVEDLSPDDALTWYFKAVLSSRKCRYPDADVMEHFVFEECLEKCISIDSRYLDIALSDGDIDEDMLKEFMKYNGLDY